MKRIRNQITALFIVLVLPGCVSSSKYEALEQQHQTLQQEHQDTVAMLAKIKEEKSALQSELSETAAEAEMLRAQKSEISSERDRIAQERDALEEANSDMEDKQEIETLHRLWLEERITELRAERDELDEQSRQLLVQLERMHRSRSMAARQLDEVLDNLAQNLEDELGSGAIQIERVDNSVKIKMSENVLFASGSNRINSDGERVLKRIAATLEKLEDVICVVEGHTDSIPIGRGLRSRWVDNWELGAARASNVVRFLEEKEGIPSDRLAAMSYGENRPIASNENARGREQNRRIEISIVKNGADLAESDGETMNAE